MCWKKWHQNMFGIFVDKSSNTDEEPRLNESS